MDHLDPLARLVAEHECVRLNHRYARYADRGQASRIGELFTVDGLFEGPGIRWEGREQISSMLTTRERLTRLRTIHLLTGIEISVDGADEASGWVTLCLHRRVAATETAAATDTRPVLLGHYEDRYRRVDGTWLLAHRRQHVAFHDPSDPGWDVPGAESPVAHRG